MSIKLRRWDAAEHLKTDEDIAAYLKLAYDERDPALIAAAMDDVAPARRIIGTAENTLLQNKK